jgi:hypothetical protein
MLIKLLEIYEEVIHHNKAEGIKNYMIREVVINPDYIITLRNETIIEKYLRDCPSSFEGLQKDQKFTRISINKGNSGNDIIVLGNLDTIFKMFDMGTKKVIKG